MICPSEHPRRIPEHPRCYDTFFSICTDLPYPKTAIVIAKSLCENFIVHYGFSARLHSDKGRNWKTLVASLVHAYKSTRHESNGFAPHYPMFGRFQSLVVDAFLRIRPKCESANDASTYVSKLKSRLNFAYKPASQRAKKRARHSKDIYDSKVLESIVHPGNLVLVRNVGLNGKQKLSDRWNRQPHDVIAQSNKDIPVFSVKREHRKG